MSTTNAHAGERSPGEWRPAIAPDIESGRLIGLLAHCSWCGSMTPADVAAAIAAGARLEFADAKYGWPHKVYLDRVPNPHAGLPEAHVSTTTEPSAESVAAVGWVKVPTGFFSELTGEPTFRWVEPPRPAPPVTNGKFYTVHLQDATPEDRVTIERALGVSFTFWDDRVEWRRFVEPEPAA